MTDTPEDHFPDDYRAAREAFVEAAEAAEMGVTTRVHPKTHGVDGKPLFLDVATAGPRNAKRALLLISGTHGVEGYFGSGVQTGLLRQGVASARAQRRQACAPARAQPVRLFLEPARQRAQRRHQPQFRRSRAPARERGL